MLKNKVLLLVGEKKWLVIFIYLCFYLQFYTEGQHFPFQQSESAIWSYAVFCTILWLSIIRISTTTTTIRIFIYKCNYGKHCWHTYNIQGKVFLLIDVDHFWKPRQSAKNWKTDDMAITTSAVKQLLFFLADEQKTWVSLPIFILMHHTTVGLPYFFSKKSSTGQKILTCVTTFKMLY